MSVFASTIVPIAEYATAIMSAGAIFIAYLNTRKVVETKNELLKFSRGNVKIQKKLVSSLKHGQISPKEADALFKLISREVDSSSSLDSSVKRFTNAISLARSVRLLDEIGSKKD